MTHAWKKGENLLWSSYVIAPKTFTISFRAPASKGNNDKNLLGFVLLFCFIFSPDFGNCTNIILESIICLCKLLLGAPALRPSPRRL